MVIKGAGTVIKVSQSCEVQIRFHLPPLELRRYLTTFYIAEWKLPDGELLVDHLMPEWANLRFHSGALPEAETQAGMRLAATSFAATGPSSESVRFTVGSSRMWGIGLLPLGWAKFVRAPAAELANAAVDGFAHPAFASFAPLGHAIFAQGPDTSGELDRITRHFLARIDEPVADLDGITAIHRALVDPETTTVAKLVEQSGVSHRAVERICRRAFGFSPKVLLRRQRFMRSLSHFMLDPSLRWIGAIDGHYHDQAQFVRDFRQFMGMTPRQYAALPKPLIGAVMRERVRFFGSAVQALDNPGGPQARA